MKDYLNKVCPFKVDAAIISDTYNRYSDPGLLKCIGPDCMAWTKYGGDHNKNCMRMH